MKPSSLSLSLQRPWIFIIKWSSIFSLGFSAGTGSTLTVYVVPSAVVTARTVSLLSAEPFGSGTWKPCLVSRYCSQPAGSAAGPSLVFATVVPDEQAAISRNLPAQLSGATFAQVRSFASRAHSSAARTWSPQPAGGG